MPRDQGLVVDGGETVRFYLGTRAVGAEWAAGKEEAARVLCVGAEWAAAEASPRLSGELESAASADSNRTVARTRRLRCIG
jgi:hypothetical protein